MASSFTGLGTELMTTGENAGTWGTTTNTNLQIVEQISGGYVEQDIAGSADTTTLSVSDGSAGAVLAHRIIKFTGTITGNQIVTIPLDVQQLYVLVNGTSGAYTVQFKYASGSGSSVTFAATDKGTKLVYATADHATNPNLVDTGIASTGDHDLDGNELILDADADTSITADTDDQIDIRISGADDFQFTANTFTAQAGSTIAAQALTATTVTASGIVKTDDTTEATSTTDGSLQTDGGLSVAKDAVIGDDLKLLSDSAVLSFGADSDTTLTHTDGTGLTLNSTNKLLFRDTGLYINSSTDGQLDLVADTEIQIAATTIDINGAVALNGAITGATNITLSGELDAATLDISGNADIDGTTNLDAVDIDGAVQLDATLTVGADDQGYDVKLFGDTASAYMLWDTSADDLILGGAAGLIVPDGQFTLGSTAVSATAAEINLIDGGTSRGTTAVADGDGLLVNDAGTMRMTNVTTLKTYFQSGASVAADDISTGDGAVTIATSSGNITIDATANDTDIIFKGTDATSDITMLTLDGSEAGAATFNDKVIATELDISGNCDIDGTTNLDAVDIDGAVQLDATLTIGADDQGYDVILYGDTASANMTWDTSADDLIFNGGAGLIVPDGQFTLGSTAVSSTAAELNLLDGGTSVGSSITLADGDGVVTNDGGTMKTIPASDIKTYVGSAAGAFSIANLDIDGGTDIGEAIVDADLFIVDNGAGGTNRKVAASRLVTYIDANSSAASVGKAIAMAIVFG